MRDAHVEMARRLVEQQDRRLLREPERDPDALPFAGAQRRKETLARSARCRTARERAVDGASSSAPALPLATSDDARSVRSRRRRATSSASNSTSSPVTNATRRARSSGAQPRARRRRRSRWSPALRGVQPRDRAQQRRLSDAVCGRGPPRTRRARRARRVRQQRPAADVERDSVQFDHARAARGAAGEDRGRETPARR